VQSASRNVGADLLALTLLMGMTCFLADVVIYSLYGRLGSHIAKQRMRAWVTSLINKAAG